MSQVKQTSIGKQTNQMILGAVIAVISFVAVSYFVVFDRHQHTYRVGADTDFDDIPQSELYLQIEHTEITNVEMNELIGGRNFRYIWMVDCHKVTVDGLVNLGDHTRLDFLDASGTRVGNDIEPILSSMEYLSGLRLNRTKVTEFSAPFLEKCKHIEDLELNGCDLTEQMIVWCSKLPRLRRLTLNNCRSIEPEWFAVLANSRSIDDLGIVGTNQSIESLDAIVLIPKLRRLRIGNVTGVSNDEWKNLRDRVFHVKFTDE